MSYNCKYCGDVIMEDDINYCPICGKDGNKMKDLKMCEWENRFNTLIEEMSRISCKLKENGDSVAVEYGYDIDSFIEGMAEGERPGCTTKGL